MPGLLHHPLQLAQWCPALQNLHPPDFPVHPGALASFTTESSPNLAPPPVTLQSHPQSHHIQTLNQRERASMRQTLNWAQTQAVTQVTRMKAPLVGTLSMRTQIANLTARPGSPAVSPKGQVAVQAAVLTAPALNQKMRRRNLHQWLKCPQKLTWTHLRLACCQRSKALTQKRNRGQATEPLYTSLMKVSVHGRTKRSKMALNSGASGM